MPLDSLTIPRGLQRKMVEHCREERPLEACGILGGRAGTVTRVYPMTNVERSTSRYLMDPEEQFAVMREIWAAREELVGIYHSHPTTPAYPSATDVKLAYYPEAVYVIVSLAAAPPDVGAFRITEGSVTPVPIRLLDAEEGLWRDLRKKT